MKALLSIFHAKPARGVWVFWGYSEFVFGSVTTVVSGQTYYALAETRQQAVSSHKRLYPHHTINFTARLE